MVIRRRYAALVFTYARLTTTAVSAWAGSTVSFANVQPILDARCTSCHNPDPMLSMLWLKTLPDDSRCGAPMPRGTDGLGIIAPDDFAILETWISEGAQSN